MDKSICAQRIAVLQQEMKKKDIDVCLLVDRENLLYYGGIEQIECMAIVIPQEGMAEGVTLSLDLEWVKANCALERMRGYVFPMDNLGRSVVQVIGEMGYRNPVVGFERYFVGFAVYDILRSAFDEKKFVSVADIIYRQRSVKTPEEITKIRAAAQAVVAGMQAAVKAIAPGVREIDIAAEAEYAAMKAGSQGTPFRIQIVSGYKTLLTHPFADTKQVREGEIVLIHIGAKYQGYIAKMCRTAAVGVIPEEQRQIYEVLKEAQDACIAALKPGIPSNRVDKAAREVIEAHGYGDLFLDVIGYGVGLRQSEFYPMLGKAFPYPLLENMIVDVLLPTIYKPFVGGPRLTDTILIKEDKAEILTDYPRTLINI
ncbi:MAG: Xaa-Pro peptidase family protein [Clostridia bacterium]|jgi:Xaa-Pro aminopeptidase|nr:Xaa-Pro peptidase family protein [Clostridia bacterium]